MVKAMPVGTEGPKGMKEGESKFLGAREQSTHSPLLRVRATMLRAIASRD